MPVKKFNGSFFLTMLPLIIIILATTISFKLSGVSSGGTEVAFINDPRRLIVLGFAYLLAVIVFFNNFQFGLKVLSRQWLYLLMLCYVIASLFWSKYPIKVFIGFGHYVGVLFSVIAAAVCFKKDREMTLLVLSVVFTCTVTLSILVSLTMPSIGLHYVAGRWQGVSGNPNTLGAVCISAMWVNITLYLMTKSVKIKLIVLVGVIVSIAALAGARSMTSILVTVMMVLGVYVFTAIEHKPRYIKKIIFYLTVYGVLTLVLLLYTFYPEKFTYESALGSIGKDATFTGRTDIWEVAFSMIGQRPIAGYSFDSLMSVFHSLGYTITQFHNGYIDYIIRGGFIGFFFFVWLLFLVMYRVKKNIKKDYKYSVATHWMIFSILIHNLTEASIMRDSSILWIMFVWIISTVGIIPASKQKKRNIIAMRICAKHY
jgi:O-antigen ligase